MYRVLFQHSDGSLTSLAQIEDHNDAARVIQKHLDMHGYHSYYWRTTIPEYGHELVDVGSWSEFYHIIDENEINIEAFLSEKAER